MNADRMIDLMKLISDDVRTDYSGRGMYGKTCIGFVVDDSVALSAVAEIMYEAEDEDERHELANLFSKAKTDSMGRSGVIVYFPRLTMAE